MTIPRGANPGPRVSPAQPDRVQAAARVVTRREDMTTRRGARPGILVSRGQRDRVEAVDFVAVADDLALGIAIAPADPRARAADAGQAVVDMDKAGCGHAPIAPRRAI